MQGFYLTVKYLLGWGRDPVTLRMFSKTAFLNALLFVLFMPFIALILLFYQLDKHYPAQAYWAHTIPLIGLYLGVFIACGIIAGTWYYAMARRGEAFGIAVAWGQCYQVLYQAKRVIFARIGASETTARWYVLPESWEATLRSPGTTFELDVLNGTGYVTQLRRLGAQPQTLDVAEIMAEQLLTIDEQATAIDMNVTDEPFEPTKTEQRALRRAARPKGRYWGISLVSMTSLVITGLLSGIIYIGLIIWFDLSIQAIPRRFTSSDVITFVLFSGFFVLIGISQIVWGIALLPRTLRLYRARHEPDEVIVGTVVNWAIFHGFGNDSGITIIKIQLDSGKEQLFRVQPRFIHRARTIGVRVQINYRPISERVTYIVTLADDPTPVRGDAYDPSA